MCSKLIFKRLSLKLTTGSAFIFNLKCYKQTDGCTMKGLLSVVFYDIYITKLEKDAILPPRKPKLYKRFADDIFTRRKANVPDQLLEFLNNYHPNIKLTYEINPEKFIDTKICYKNSSITIKVYRSITNLTPHWSSSIPKKCKRNAIHRDSCRAERISSDFNKQKMLIRQKFDNVGNPSPFTNSIIRDYEHKQNKRQQQEDEYIIPPNFFEIAKESILVEFPYCPQNKLVAKRFLPMFHQFTNQFKVTVKWITKRVKSLFLLKGKTPFPACQINRGTCVCNETYIRETIGNVDIRWNEHEDIRKESEPAKHLKDNLNHKFK